MIFDQKSLKKEQLISFYEAMMLPRLVEEKMLILLRQNKISKWFSGIGQEAISVGAALALNDDEYILPMHRNLGVFTTRDVPLQRLFSQFQGKASGFTKGRDRSFHFGSVGHKIVGMISHLGPQLSIADGIGLAEKFEKTRNAVLVFTGDGGASQGEFHEALNVAAVWRLPVLFVVENNQWGLSTPSDEQFKCKAFVDKAIGYGIEAIQLDGNNILDVYHGVSKAAEQARTGGGPIIVECLTFRIRGHEEASGTKYYPKGMIEEWSKKDPVHNFEQFLRDEKVLNDQLVDEIQHEIKSKIDKAWSLADAEPMVEASLTEELNDLFSPYSQEVIPSANQNSRKIRFVDAISEGLKQSMERYNNLVLMGQDIAEYGGVFKVTEGFLDLFGKDRVRNTPLCESAIIGSGLGLSIRGYKSVIEMQFADFVTCGFNQIVNNLAKIHYRWGQSADVVIRMPTGAGVGAGPFHSQSNEAWFFKTPGLKIVYPSNPEDAKGLLAAAIEDPNPYLYFEHKALYRAISDDVPEDYYTTEVGKARLVREGNDLSVITYGMGVHWANEVIDGLDISADVLDLRTLMPWDNDSVAKTTKKTGKVLILHEDTLTGGIGAEISAWISEHCFENLDAPVARVASLDTPVPFAMDLEDNFLPQKRLAEKIKDLLAY